MSEWIPTSELPAETPSARYLMILDGVEQVCHECTEPGDRQRWFYGSVSGAYPVYEIDFFKLIE